MNFLTAFFAGSALAIGGMAMAQDHMAQNHMAHQMDHNAHQVHQVSHQESANNLQFEQCWVRFRSDNASALYLSIHNKDSQNSAHIVGVTSPAFESMMLHQSKEENGMMRMDHVMRLDIPAQHTLRLEPGSYHVMAFNPQHIKVGDEIKVNFELSNGEVLSTHCVVKKMSARGFAD